MRSRGENINFKYTYNVNNIPYLNGKNISEVKMMYCDLSSLTYDACLDLDYMIMSVNYITDYLLDNYTEIGKKEIKKRLKELQFYTKKPIKSILELNKYIQNSKRYLDNEIGE